MCLGCVPALFSLAGWPPALAGAASLWSPVQSSQVRDRKGMQVYGCRCSEPVPCLSAVAPSWLSSKQACSFFARSASVGIILPAYQSYKAIENKKDNKADEQWCVAAQSGTRLALRSSARTGLTAVQRDRLRHLVSACRLTYWVIYAGLSLVEEVEDWGLAKLPYYWHAKFAFLLWLQMPQSQVGATVPRLCSPS